MADRIVLQQRPPAPWYRRAWAQLTAGRRRHEPERDTDVYPRIMSTMGGDTRRPIAKSVPINLRTFGRTPYASRAILTYQRPISMLEWDIVPVDKDTATNSELQRQCDVIKRCLHEPNHADSFTTWVQQMVDDILTTGAGASEVQIGGDQGRPLWLWPVDATTIQIYPKWDGDPAQPRYAQALGFGNVSGGNMVSLLSSELMYMRDRPTTDNPYSYGMLEVAFATINRLMATGEYAGNVAGNATPSSLLWFKNMTESQMRALRSYWRNEIEGQGQLPMVSGYEDAKILNLRTADDKALFLGYQAMLIREISAAFGISAQNLSIEADVNRNTSETAEDRDWDVAIKPVARLIESHVNRDAIHGALGFTQVRFQFKGLDRDDEEMRSQINERNLQNSIVTINEVRESLGLQPSLSQFGDMVKADIDIAVAAAKGAATADARNTSKS